MRLIFITLLLIAPMAQAASVFEEFADLDNVSDLIEEPCGPYVNYAAQCFTLKIVQPINHWDSEAGSLEQRVRVIHRSFDAPVALRTRGYAVYDDAAAYKYYPIEPTHLVEGNLIDVEHRYFGTSIPQGSFDWSQLNIFQAAMDMHEVVSSLRNLYSGKWISFGYSKGGMTATYHRTFFPDDVDATIPYVAPLSLERADKRYNKFLSEVGNESCRQQLIDFQRDVLTRRDEIVPALDDFIAGNDTANRWPDGTFQAIEYLVGEYAFAFWQYGPGLSACKKIPKPGMPAVEVIENLNDIVGVYGFMDSGFDRWQPYYWQALTELGYGGLGLKPLSDLLLFNAEDYSVYAPENVYVPAHKPWVMQVINQWAKYQAERVLYVYGELDPYTAAAYPVVHQAEYRNVYRFDMPGGNHGARISRLQQPDQLTASNIVRAWAGLAPMTLDDSRGLVLHSAIEHLPEPPLEGRR